MWGCLQDAPIDEGRVAELERQVRSATAALRALDRRLADARVGSLADAAAARRTLRAVLDGMAPVGLRDACVAVEHLVAEMEALAAALALVRRLREASVEGTTAGVAKSGA